MIKENAKKVLNEEKVVDLTGMPITSYEGNYMMPVSKIGDILLAEVDEQNGQYMVRWKEKTATITPDEIKVIGGVEMVSLENLLNELDRAYVKEGAKGFLVVGNIVTMNNSKTLNNIMDLIERLETLGDTVDVSYQN